MTRRLLIGTEDGIHHLDSDVVDLAGHRITALAGNWAIPMAASCGAWKRAVRPSRWPGWTGRRPATCLLPVADAVLVGTAEGHLVRVERGVAQAVGGFDTVDGREAWHTPWGGPADVRSMATGDNVVYVNVHVGGILASLDRGITWSPTDLDIDTDVHQVLAVDHRVLAALGHSGLASSQRRRSVVDGGDRWPARQLLPGRRRRGRAGCCSAPPPAPAPVTPPCTGAASDGDTFERCEKGLPEWFDDNIDTGCLVLDGTTAAFGTADGRVFVSDDAGDSWTEAAAGVPPVTAIQLAAA